MVERAAGDRPAPVPTRRVVLLGASNVTLGLSTVVETARIAWGRPLEIMAAIGHGRSFGMTSTVLGRTLPGITQCGLWEALQQRPPLPTAALLTDIGNDIAYGSRVGPILRWVETCLKRLADHCDRLVVTRLPLSSVAALPRWKFRLISSLLFPSSRIDRTELLARGEELDEQILQFASRFGAYVVQPEKSWYGWDPIHVSRVRRAEAWATYLGCWSDGRQLEPARPSFRRWLKLMRARPLKWRLFGMDRHRDQPTSILRDGTTLSLY